MCVCKSCVCSHMNTQSWCVLPLLAVMSLLKASECCRQMNRSRSKKPFSSSKTNFVTRVRSCTGKKIIDLSQHFLVTANRKCNQTAVTCAVFLSFSSGLCWCTHCSLIPQQILRTFFCWKTTTFFSQSFPVRQLFRWVSQYRPLTMF